MRIALFVILTLLIIVTGKVMNFKGGSVGDVITGLLYIAGVVWLAWDYFNERMR